jgi:hypothetical protein
MYPKLQKVWKELMRDTVKGTWKISTIVGFETITRIEGEHLKLFWLQYRDAISRQKSFLKNWMSRTELTYKKNIRKEPNSLSYYSENHLSIAGENNDYIELVNVDKD